MITKNGLLVIFLLLVLFGVAGCTVSGVGTNADDKREYSGYFSKPKVLGRISDPKIDESSGLAVSPCQKNVFWTHNDSGSGAEIFAIDQTGRTLGRFTVAGATNTDWEDIAIYKSPKGECFLYIGDFGNNAKMRSEHKIYKVREPLAANKGGATERATMIRFSYPDINHDAEAILVAPGEKIYVITKSVSFPAGVYRIDSKTGKAELKGRISVPSLPNGLITGADVTADGKRVVVCDYFGAYEYALSDNAKDFDEIWKSKPKLIDAGKREQGEAVAYSPDGMKIYLTSEKARSPLIEVARKRKG
ncbi:MAG: hypothetical protein R2684_08935 [Pyrinomonadaceae bacterium]